MKEIFILDACALIAFLNDEPGADKVENILQKAKRDNCVIYINKLNVLEIYYGVFREDGNEKGFRILEFDFDDLETLLTLPFHHQDPFDRMIISQVQTKSLEIITNDSVVQKYFD